MQEGQTIKHELFGLGIVTSSDSDRTAIDFDDHGPKLFVTSMLTAELIGEAPATPPKTKRRRKVAVSRLELTPAMRQKWRRGVSERAANPIGGNSTIPVKITRALIP